jgi:hypothetical protein
MKKTLQATLARVRKGQKTTDRLLRLIRSSRNGKTVYELSKITGMSAGSCKSALERSPIILCVEIENDGRNIKKRYSLQDGDSGEQKK